MQDEEQPQHLKDQEAADKDLFSSNSTDAQYKRRESNLSGNAEFASQIEDTKSEKKKNKKQEEKDRKSLLYVQLQEISIALSDLEDKIKDYGSTIRQAEELELSLPDTTAMSEDIMAVMAKYPGLAGRHQLLRGYYSQLEALEGTPDNLWAQLKDNVLRDSEGNIVYLEGKDIYRLKRDESGEITTEIDPKTGEIHPARKIIENPIERMQILAEAYNEGCPKLFGNETPFGEDTRNHVFNQQNQWGIIYKKDGIPILDHNPQHIDKPLSLTMPSPEEMEVNIQNKDTEDPPSQAIPSHKEYYRPPLPFASFEETDDGNFITCKDVGALAEQCVAVRNEYASVIKEHKEKNQIHKENLSKLKEEKENAGTSETRLKKLNEEIKEEQSILQHSHASLLEVLDNIKNPIKKFAKRLGFGGDDEKPAEKQKTEEKVIAAKTILNTQKDFSAVAEKSTTATYNYLQQPGNVYLGNFMTPAPKGPLRDISPPSAQEQFLQNLTDITGDKKVLPDNKLDLEHKTTPSITLDI